jgi:hypothetical protein
MNYRGRSSHADDYIDRAGDGIGWGPILLAIAFIAMLGFLLFVPPGQSDKRSNNQQNEITTPGPAASRANPK